MGAVVADQGVAVAAIQDPLIVGHGRSNVVEILVPPALIPDLAPGREPDQGPIPETNTEGTKNTPDHHRLLSLHHHALLRTSKFEITSVVYT